MKKPDFDLSGFVAFLTLQKNSRISAWFGVIQNA